MTQQHSKWARPSPTIRVGVLGLLAAFLLVLPLVPAPRSQAFIYWAGKDSIGIGRANLNGTGVDRGFLDVDGSFMTVDARHIYWVAGKKGDAVARARIDGTGIDRRYITRFFPLRCARFGCFGDVNDLTVDAGHIYGATSRTIVRANLDGTGVDQNFIRTSFLPTAVAADASHVYWVSYRAFPARMDTIGRANLDGTGVDEQFISGLDLPPVDIAVGASHVYWRNHFGTIGRANLDGTGVEQNFIDAPMGGSPAGTPGAEKGLAVDEGHIYWNNWFDRTIGRANLDGTGVNSEFIRVGSSFYVAVNALSPVGKVTADRTQRQKGNQIRIKVGVKAKQRLTARATGKVKINPTYALRPKTLKVAKGRAKILRLKPKTKAQAKKIAATLKRGEKATAKVTVKLTDRAGNTETEKLRVRLKR